MIMEDWTFVLWELWKFETYGNINAHRGPGAFAEIRGIANITAKTPTVVFCMTFDAKGLDVTQKKEW